MKLGALRFLALCGLTAGWCGVARSATLTWINPAGGDWNSTNNWSPGQAPASGDNVVITQNGTYTVTNTGSATLGSLTLGAASGIQNAERGFADADQLEPGEFQRRAELERRDLESSLTVGQGGTLTISNTVLFCLQQFFLRLHQHGDAYQFRHSDLGGHDQRRAEFPWWRWRTYLQCRPLGVGRG